MRKKGLLNAALAHHAALLLTFDEFLSAISSFIQTLTYVQQTVHPTDAYKIKMIVKASVIVKEVLHEDFIASQAGRWQAIAALQECATYNYKKILLYGLPIVALSVGALVLQPKAIAPSDSDSISLKNTNVISPQQHSNELENMPQRKNTFILQNQAAQDKKVVEKPRERDQQKNAQKMEAVLKKNNRYFLTVRHHPEAPTSNR